MYRLRQTWNDIFPNIILYALDRKIREDLDPAWPITAKQEELTIPTIPSEAIEDVGKPSGSKKRGGASTSTGTSTPPTPSIHVNPKFLKKVCNFKSIKYRGLYKINPYFLFTKTRYCIVLRAYLIRINTQFRM